MLLPDKISNVEIIKPYRKKNFIALKPKKYTLSHLMIVKACFENQSSLQAKIAFRDLSEVLCSAVFIGQEEQKFFLVLASLNLLFETSLSQKLELGCVY